jgi:hypothetical protein
MLILRRWISPERRKRKYLRTNLPSRGLAEPANEGLFGDGACQTDLIDLAGRPKADTP